MDKLWLIIKREYLNKIRNRTFIIMTFVSPLIFVGIAVLIGLLTSINNDNVKKIAILDQTGHYQDLFTSTNRYQYIPIDDNIESAIIATDQADYYGLLYINNQADQLSITFYSNDAPDTRFVNDIQDRINNKATDLELIDRGVDLDMIQDAQITTTIKLENYKGIQTSKLNLWVKMAFGGGAGYLLMMFIVIYGNMVMRSVIEEKTNRIIEVIISSVKPIYLMLGKITGTSLAGITQFLIWLIIGSILTIVATTILGPDAVNTPGNDLAISQIKQMDQLQLIYNDIMQLPLVTLILCFFVYFIGGYFLYAAIYTAIGAAVDSETDTQQFMLPVILPLILSIYVGFFSVMDNPNGSVAVIFSYIPLTSPIVMLMRIPFGEIAYWQLLISILLLYISIFGVAWIAAKIYRIGILMYGTKTNWKVLYKWLKY